MLLNKFRKSAPFRKSKSIAKRIPKALKKVRSTKQDYLDKPPILVNSLPKSGTHLLMQLANAIPMTVNFGAFIAQTPSLTLREKPDSKIVSQLKSLVPGEVSGAHIFHTDLVENAILNLGALHLFIYRDPRDVIASEAFYLAKMNRWHRMHKHFKKLDTPSSQFKMALNGHSDLYPEANIRLLPYANWIRAENVLSFRYEDLVGPKRGIEIERLISTWMSRSSTGSRSNISVEYLLSAIDPSKSHTFRNGVSGKWRDNLSRKEIENVTKKLEPSLIAFGYET